MSEAATAMEGTVIRGNAETWFEGATLDSRGVHGGELFFALAGERTDGHRFVGDALGRGAAGAVVQQAVAGLDDLSDELALIEVHDTLEALHALTRHVRREVPDKLVAITGSAGKTTTKELLATMLSKRYRVAKSPGNLNNLYGFPVALLSIADDTEWMVAEMGMSVPGELGGVSRLGRPDVAVMTNVRPAHLEAFEQQADIGAGRLDAETLLRAVGDAKAELFEGLRADGLIVANGNDPEVVRIVERRLEATPETATIWYGLSDDGRGSVDGRGLEVWAMDVRPSKEGDGMHFVLVQGDARVEVELGLHGSVNVENFLSAAAMAHALGFGLDEIAATAREAAPMPGRGRIHRLGGDVCLIDDSYNSNPAALDQALRAARELPGVRHWAVLGDMLELGSEGPAFHRQAGERAAALGFDPVLGVGELSRHLVEGAGSLGTEAEWLVDAPSGANRAAALTRPGDVVLVKGSRGVGLEAVVEAMLRVMGEASDEGEPGGGSRG